MKKKNLTQLKFEKRFEYSRCIVFDEKTLRQRGVVFEVVKFPPETRNKPHFHKNAAEIFYVREGKGFIKIGQIRFPVKKDDILFVPPGKKHQVINISDQEMTLLVVKTDGSDADTYR